MIGGRGRQILGQTVVNHDDQARRRSGRVLQHSIPRRTSTDAVPHRTAPYRTVSVLSPTKSEMPSHAQDNPKRSHDECSPVVCFPSAEAAKHPYKVSVRPKEASKSRGIVH